MPFPFTPIRPWRSPLFPIRPFLAPLVALAPLAAQTWGDWRPASRQAPVELRIAAQGWSGSGPQRVKWELANRSPLFHLEFVFGFAHPEATEALATPGQLVTLGPGQTLQGSTELSWEVGRGVYSLVLSPCFLPSAGATATCFRPGRTPRPEGSDAEAAWDRYREHLARAVQEEPEALAVIAGTLARGIGAFLPRDPEAAVRFHARAALRGRTASRLALAEAYDQGTWIAPDPAAATRWYREAAEQGETVAVDAMILRSYRGIGMARSLPDTLTWVRKALAAGDIEAVPWLARLRKEGVPLSQVEWAEAKARLDGAGDTPALRTYLQAVLLDEGLDGPREERKATATFVALAEEGLDYALVKVAERLAEGQHGLPKDPTLAWTLLSLTPEDLERQMGTALRARLTQILTSDQRTRAEALAATFRARMDKTEVYGLKAHLAKLKP